MKPIILFLIFSTVQILNAGDFDNWFFKFSKQKHQMVAKTTTMDGVKFGTTTGTISGKVTNNGSLFTGVAKMHYLPQNVTVSATVIWKKISKNIFKGTFKASNGNTAVITLTLSDNKQFKTKTTMTGNVSQRMEGKLDSDGKIRSKGAVYGPQNQKMMLIEETYSPLSKKDLSDKT